LCSLATFIRCIWQDAPHQTVSRDGQTRGPNCTPSARQPGCYPLLSRDPLPPHPCTCAVLHCCHTIALARQPHMSRACLDPPPPGSISYSYR
jgi:hypothetical protein